MQLPWRRAPQAALSSPLTILVTMVAALLLSFVASAAVLHSASVLAVVAAVALVLAVEVRRRQNAWSGALATRMGLRRKTLTASHALELGSLAGLATTTGCVTGLVTTGVSVPLFDPAPWLRPIASIPDMVPLVSLVYLAAAVVVGLVTWTAVRSVRTAQVGELIRG